jgi:hypothetical protein
MVAAPPAAVTTAPPSFFNTAATPTLGSLRQQTSGGASAYLDNAVPRTLIRLRYAAGYHNNAPGRGEYFYPQFGPARNARQPLSFQEFSTYLEYAPRTDLSLFLDVPTRVIFIPAGRQPDGRIQPSQQFSGFSDLRLGFKYALIAQPDAFYTFQLKTYLPTGTGGSGLGTNHASLEPGFLAFQRLSERLYFLGQFTDWIPLHGSLVNDTANPRDPFQGRRFASNVINYGAGLFYNLALSDRRRVAPSAEVVGWTFLGGLKEIAEGRFQSASGDTIVNAKVGLRFGLGDYTRGGPLNDRLNFYAGYSRALTEQILYRNMFRIELTWYF